MASSARGNKREGDGGAGAEVDSTVKIQEGGEAGTKLAGAEANGPVDEAMSEGVGEGRRVKGRGSGR